MTVERAEITSFIINELETHPSSVVVRAAKEFGISRQAVLKRIKGLIKQGDIVAHGSTKGRVYSLASNVVWQNVLRVQGLEEDVVYREHVRPALGEMPDNIQRICNYGFTEILNNAIDHSLSETVLVQVSRTPCVIDLIVHDVGIGIFRKIKEAFRLEDERQSLIELSKGKVTTDKEHHSGQGIFFTSRIFDHFSIFSGNLFFWHRTDHDDWLMEDAASHAQGTMVRMRICTHAKTQIKEVFDRYSTPENEFAFARTHVPIALAQYGEDSLVSRSQAKRILSRFEQFEEVMLDFDHVRSIGQAFADEIFRVFRRNNPSIKMSWMRANSEVEAMIQRAVNDYDRDVNTKSPG